MIPLFRPQIEWLLRHRDEVINKAHLEKPDEDVLEDRSLESTGYFPVDVDSWLEMLGSRGRRLK